MLTAFPPTPASPYRTRCDIDRGGESPASICPAGGGVIRPFGRRGGSFRKA